MTLNPRHIQPKKMNLFDKVMLYVCREFEVDSYQVKSKSRKAKNVRAREAVVYILRYLNKKKYTLDSIANYLNRDHSSIIHNERQAAVKIEKNTFPIFTAKVKRIITIIMENENEYFESKIKEIRRLTELPDSQTAYNLIKKAI